MNQDNDFMEKASLELKARNLAAEILGIDEKANKETLKRAYHKAAKKFHPDKNSNDKKFVLIKSAYELLVNNNIPSEFMEIVENNTDIFKSEKYNLDNKWGHFLWWREKFFDSDKEKGQNNGNKRSFCI